MLTLPLQLPGQDGFMDDAIETEGPSSSLILATLMFVQVLLSVVVRV